MLEERFVGKQNFMIFEIFCIKYIYLTFDRGYTLIGKLIEICEKLVKIKLCNKNPRRKL